MRKATRKTVLLCCEGKADQTFVAYLRSIYTARRPGAPYAMLALLDPIRIGGARERGFASDLLTNTVKHRSRSP